MTKRRKRNQQQKKVKNFTTEAVSRMIVCLFTAVQLSESRYQSGACEKWLISDCECEREREWIIPTNLLSKSVDKISWQLISHCKWHSVCVCQSSYHFSRLRFRFFLRSAWLKSPPVERNLLKLWRRRRREDDGDEWSESHVPHNFTHWSCFLCLCDCELLSVNQPIEIFDASASSYLVFFVCCRCMCAPPISQ